MSFPDWRGVTAVVVASGPSLSSTDCAAVRFWRSQGGPRRVIAVNTSFLRAPWADVVYACDGRWWCEWIGQVRERAVGDLWTLDVAAAKQFGLHLVASEAGGGLPARPGAIRQGGNSGFQAVGLAQLFGAEHVVLLGFDMQRDARGRTHWHADHARVNPKDATFSGWRAAFEQLAEAAPGVVVNCSAQTALRCFPRRQLLEALWTCPRS